MEKIYEAPKAEPTVFKVAQTLADVQWSDLLENKPGDNSAAKVESSDIVIKL